MQFSFAQKKVIRAAIAAWPGTAEVTGRSQRVAQKIEEMGFVTTQRTFTATFVRVKDAEIERVRKIVGGTA